MKTFEHIQTSTNYFANTQTTHTVIRSYQQFFGLLEQGSNHSYAILLHLQNVFVPYLDAGPVRGMPQGCV
jgi:hypothetical protein